MFRRGWTMGLLAALASSAALRGGIVGSKHDFSRRGWNASGEVCVVCHAPHAVGAPETLLWNRPLTGTVFTPFASPTLKAAVGQPSGVSRLCLSCHDGTIAVDSFGDAPGGAEAMPARGNLGTSMMGQHPVSFVFDDALAAASEGQLKTPSTSPSYMGGTVAEDLLRDGKMECISCHEPHNRHENTYMLIAPPGRFPVRSTAGAMGNICFRCHWSRNKERSCFGTCHPSDGNGANRYYPPRVGHRWPW